MRSLRTPLLIALLLGMASPLQAQFGPSLRGAGMAGAYAGLARGHEAIVWNPALLGLSNQPAWSLGLPGVHIGATILGPDALEMIDVMGKGTDITSADRAKILDAFSGSEMELQVSGRGNWAGLSAGSFALGVSTTAIVRGSVGREMLDMMLSIREAGDVDLNRLNEYRVGNTTARSAAYSTLSAAYAKRLRLMPVPVSIGVTGHYLHGHSLQQGRIFEPEVNHLGQDIEMAVLSVNATGGWGYALDLGVAIQPTRALTLSLSIDNLVHSLEWDEDLELLAQTIYGKDLVELGVTEIADGFDSTIYVEDNAPPAARALAQNLSKNAYLPRNLRIGAGLDIKSTGTALGVTYSNRQGDGELHVGWPTYLAVGVEQRLPILRIFTIRGGYATSLDGNTALTGGIGLGLGPINITTAALLERTDNGGTTTTGRANTANGVGLSIGIDLMPF